DRSGRRGGGRQGPEGEGATASGRERDGRGCDERRLLGSADRVDVLESASRAGRGRYGRSGDRSPHGCRHQRQVHEGPGRNDEAGQLHAIRPGEKGDAGQGIRRAEGYRRHGAEDLTVTRGRSEAPGRTDRAETVKGTEAKPYCWGGPTSAAVPSRSTCRRQGSWLRSRGCHESRGARRGDGRDFRIAR